MDIAVIVKTEIICICHTWVIQNYMYSNQNNESYVAWFDELEFFKKATSSMISNPSVPASVLVDDHLYAGPTTV